MKTALLVGLMLTAALGGLSAALWGGVAGRAALAGGLLGTAIQVTAAGLIGSARTGPVQKLVARWGLAAGLRMVGVLLVGVAVLVDRVAFPPTPSVLGFGGVLLPLLFLELRTTK